MVKSKSLLLKKNRSIEPTVESNVNKISGKPITPNYKIHIAKGPKKIQISISIDTIEFVLTDKVTINNCMNLVLFSQTYLE